VAEFEVRTKYVVFARVGASREPLGIYEGRGRDALERTGYAERLCRDELGAGEVELSVVPVAHCTDEQLRLANEAQARSM